MQIRGVSIEWDGRIGPAFIAGICAFIGTIFTAGVIYTQIDGGVRDAQKEALEARQSAIKAQEQNRIMQDAINSQSERLGKTETALTFIVPTLARIETKVDELKK